MSTFKIIPDDQVPEPSAFGGVRNPIDEDFADFCEEHPGRWIEYPLADRYPHLWDGTPTGFKKCATRIASAISTGRKKGKPMGSYVTEEGRFETRRDPANLRVLIRWVWDGWKDAA